MAFDWSSLGSPLQGIGSGLMAAGAGGWQQFAPAYARGALLGQQQLQYKDEKKLRELEAERMQAALDQQRTANTDAEARKKQWADYIARQGGIMSPGTATPPIGSGGPQLGPGMMQGGGLHMTPEQWQYLQTVGPEQGQQLIGEQLFKDQPQDKWQITQIREGNQDVTYRINPQTGERERLGAGAAWAPQQPQQGGNPEFGLAPFMTVDDKGITHAYQLSKSGGMQEVPLPQGQTVAPQTQMINQGTQYSGVDRRTGLPVGAPLPIDVSGKAAQTEVGQGQGQAQFNLPAAEANAQRALDRIEAIRKDPARTSTTGWQSAVGLSSIPGTAGYGFVKRVEELKSGAFLSAIDSLRGMGALSNAEGEKGTAAITRMDTSTNDKDFEDALNDYEEVVKIGLGVIRQKAGGGAQQPSAKKSPAEMSDDELLNSLGAKP